MWTTINDCGKQLTVHSKVREKNDNDIKVYDIVEVEFDQYKLELITRDGPAPEKQHQILTCEQLVQFHFEVEKNET